MENEGISFKNDNRFYFLYRNVGDWGQGERDCGYEVERLEEDKSYLFSRKALKENYQLADPLYQMNNQFSCYAQEPNSYTFDVHGKVLACTVMLYDSKNIFGNINLKKIDEKKRDKLWLHHIQNIPKLCQECSVVAICKGGSCPKQLIFDNQSQEEICNKNKNRILQNFDLFIRQGLTEVIINVD